MPKLEIIDDILAPTDKLVLSTKGNNPSQVIGLIPQALKDILHISAVDMTNPDLRWDAVSDNREFYGKWTGTKEFDRWTSAILRVKIFGNQDKNTKVGSLKVEIKGTVETKYQYSNFLQRMFWMMFNRMFYWKQRRSYFERAKEYIYDLREEIMSAMNILV